LDATKSIMTEAPLSLLCIEPRFPGLLGPVCDWLVRKRGFRCQFYCAAADPAERWPASSGRGLDVVRFGVGGVAREAAAPWSRTLERGLCYAYGCWEVLDRRRPRPIDLALGRSAGLGSSLFALVYQSRLPIVQLFDYYLHPKANDLADEAGPDTPLPYYRWRRTANAMDLLDLENGVVPWTATAWQRDLYPAEYRDDFVVIHPGVDAPHGPRRPARTRRIAGRTVPQGAKVVSFVARCLDRLRGFDRFIALAARLQRDDPNVICVAAGDPVAGRGLDPMTYQQDYQAHVLNQTPLPDPGRYWPLGPASRDAVGELLAASDLHIYPGRAYPVSRSLLEAMAHGCVVLAADLPPVREILTPRVHGLLAEPGNVESWAQQARAALADPAAHRPLGEAAAELVRTRYHRDVTLPALAALLARLIEERG
jgi:glycosyltransferase involved in cell wall biosynthesis